MAKLDVLDTVFKAGDLSPSSPTFLGLGLANVMGKLAAIAIGNTSQQPLPIV